MGLTRTQDEIVARVRHAQHNDLMGFRAEVLISVLDYEHAKGYLEPEVTAEEWAADVAEQGDIETRAKEYLLFAIGKIEDHRGISANRSVDKLGEYAWLLGRDGVVEAMDEADYAQYGAPKVKAFAEGMGWPWPDVGDVARMAQGLPCVPGCTYGCDPS